MKTMHITTHGRVNELILHEDTQLAQMQEAVGGLIEAYNDPEEDRPITFWVNEEGLIQQLPLNMVASILAGHRLHGDVVITSMSPSGTHLRELPSEYWREVAFLKLMIRSGYLPADDTQKKEDHD
jgi:hypothetical protein